MFVVPKSSTIPALPPIKDPLVDHLMQHAEHASARAKVGTPARGHLPDILNLTAKLTLGMLILCMYVPLIRDVLG